MQTDMDAQRIISLGAPKERVFVSGNIKFDMLVVSEVKKLTDIGFKAADWILVGGSTHPGEEDILLDVFEALKSEYPSLRLVLVPRHVERAQELERIVKAHYKIPVRFSQKSVAELSQEHVLIVDVIGQLRSLYGMAQCVFVGKTLKSGGGQNMIEPVMLGAYTIVGPMVSNFKDVVDLFLREKVLVQVRNVEELKKIIKQALQSPGLVASMKSNGPRVVQKYRGATDKTLEHIQRVGMVHPR
jgi:3-deoxy-D-manno-octulosonic-acid transferase